VTASATSVVMDQTSTALDVTGTADLLAGPNLAVSLQNGSLPEGDSATYTVLSSGTLMGIFGSVTDDSFFFDTSILAVGDDVELTVTRNSNTLVGVVNTPNQKAVAQTLTDAVEGGTADADLQFVLGEILVLSAPEIAPAVDSLSGEVFSSFTTPQVLNADKAARTAMARFGIVGGRAVGSPGTIDLARKFGDPGLGRGGEWLFADTSEAGPIRMLATAPVSLAPPEQRRWGAWLDGYGLFGDVDGNSNSASNDWTLGGVLGGVDVRLGKGGLLGLAGGYGKLDTAMNGRSSTGEADVYQGMLYGGYVWERFYIGALARYAYDDFDSKRRIAFGSAIHRAAKADFNGQEAGAYVEGGGVAFAPAGVQFEPMASFHYTWLEHDSFRESGAQSVDLEVDSESWDSLLGTVGLRVHKTFWMERDKSLRFVPEIWARYAHQFGDRDRPVTASFSGDSSGERFRVAGAEVGREGGIIGAGWSVTAGTRLSAFIYYDVSLNENLVAHALAGGFLVRW
jgi:subtilase-type serine protease